MELQAMYSSPSPLPPTPLPNVYGKILHSTPTAPHNNICISLIKCLMCYEFAYQRNSTRFRRFDGSRPHFTCTLALVRDAAQSTTRNKTWALAQKNGSL